MNPQPDNPTPPTNASESPEPKVQVTEADKQVYYEFEAIRQKPRSDISVLDECATLIAEHVAAAVEAAKAELAELLDKATSQEQIVKIADAVEKSVVSPLRAALIAEQRAHQKAQNDLSDLKSAYAAAIYRLQELGEKTIAITVDTALDQERTAHAATKRELKQHQSMEAEDKQGFIAIWNVVQEMSPWYESNDMDWCDEILCGLNGVKAQLDQARAEALRAEKECDEICTALECSRAHDDWHPAVAVQEILRDKLKAESSLAALEPQLEVERAAVRSWNSTYFTEKARLDWLERTLCYAMVCLEGKTNMEALQSTGRGWRDGQLRQAIDAARAAHHTASSAAQGEKAL